MMQDYTQEQRHISMFQKQNYMNFTRLSKKDLNYIDASQHLLAIQILYDRRLWQ